MPRKHSEQDFWRRVRKTDGCWHWSGARSAKGAPLANFEGVREYAWRIAHLLTTGQDLTGRRTRRTCNTIDCVNPAHVRVFPTDEEIVQARREYFAGGVTQRQLSERYGVTRPTMTRMINGHARADQDSGAA